MFPYLDERGIANIGRVNKTLREFTKDPAVWHDLYYKTFGLQPNPFTEYKWPEMYRWRRKASLYTWGSRAMGRLGYSYDEIEPLYRSTGREFGVCRPKKVERVGSIVISDIVAGGYSFTILTGEGKLIGIGDLESSSIRRTRRRVPKTVNTLSVPEGALAVPTHRATPGPHFRVGGVRTGHGRWFTPPELTGNNNNGQHQQQDDDPVNRLVTTDNESQSNNNNNGQPDDQSLVPPLTHSERAQAKELPTQGDNNSNVKFVSVSSGRQHVIALDDKNSVWLWDWSFVIPAIKLAFPIDNLKIENAIAGWGYSAVVVEKVGIVIWSDIEEKQEKVEGDTITLDEEDIIRIPGTGNVKIIDIVAGEHMLIYLTDNGELFYVHTNSEEEGGRRPVRLNGFESALDEDSKFVKLSGSFNKFAVFTDNDRVFMGHRNDIIESPANAQPRIIPGLQNVGCISVAVGDHHNLALLRGGKLLTWGRESKACGAFGLGNLDHVVNTYNIPSNMGGLDIEEPTEVETNGKVLAIAAAGWQSAAVITSDT